MVRMYLVEKIKSEGKWGLGGDANRMWEEMADCIWKSTKEILGVSRVGTRRMRGEELGGGVRR